MKVHFSSKNNKWNTPIDFFKRLDNEFEFTLDPCTTVNNLGLPSYFTEKENGLLQDWQGHRVFMNPPYGREIKKWIKKAYEESQKGALVVALIPARTDTSYWHNYVMRAKEIRLIKGRLKFGDSENPAPFPSAIVIFGRGGNKFYPSLETMKNR